MKTFNEFLGEAKVRISVKALPEITQGSDMAVISAMRDGNPDNEANTRKLQKELAGKFDVDVAWGGWIENKGSENEKAVEEKSFVVVDVNNTGNLLKEVRKLGKKYDQDAILFKPAGEDIGYAYGTSKRDDAWPSFGKKERLGKVHWGVRGEYYTKLRDGYFTFK